MVRSHFYTAQEARHSFVWSWRRDNILAVVYVVFIVLIIYFMHNSGYNVCFILEFMQIRGCDVCCLCYRFAISFILW